MLGGMCTNLSEVSYKGVTREPALGTEENSTKTLELMCVMRGSIAYANAVPWINRHRLILVIRKAWHARGSQPGSVLLDLVAAAALHTRQ